MHILAEITVAGRKVQDTVAVRVHREPVFAIHHLPVGDKGDGQILMAGTNVVRDVLAIGDNDLVFFLVNPDAPLKVAVLLFDCFGFNVENEGIDLVDLLLPDIRDVVLGGVLRGQYKWQALFDVIEIGWGHHDPRQSVGWRFKNALRSAILVVKGNVNNLIIAAVGFAIVVDSFNAHAALPGVVVESLAKNRLFRGELADDLRNGNRRLRLVEWPESLVERHRSIGSL